MRPARLHFFNEQDAPKLEAPFTDALVVRHLEALGAGVTMGLRDLRVAARACGDVSMFSLEGCVQQGFLARLLGCGRAGGAGVALAARGDGDGACSGDEGVSARRVTEASQTNSALASGRAVAENSHHAPRALTPTRPVDRRVRLRFGRRCPGGRSAHQPAARQHLLQLPVHGRLRPHLPAGGGELAAVLRRGALSGRVRLVRLEGARPVRRRHSRLRAGAGGAANPPLLLLFVAGAVAAIALPGFVARHASAVPDIERQDDDRPPAEELPFADPDDTLGLHPEGSVDSTPPGATVFLDDVEVGKTPLKTRFHAGRPSELRLELDGYFPVRRRIEVNANQHVDVRVVLERGAHVEVVTDPPGAEVRFDGGVVLTATPGTTALLPVGPAELVVLLPGYVAERRVIDLEPGTQALAVPLTPGIKVHTSSTPDHAAVALDGVPLGETPLDVYVPKKGAHTLTFSLRGLTPVQRVLTSPREGQTVRVKLVDEELIAAERKVAKAQAAYDKANQELERLQRLFERFDTAANERKVAAAEQAMEKAATALEKAEAELAALREERGIEPPPSPRSK